MGKLILSISNKSSGIIKSSEEVIKVYIPLFSIISPPVKPSSCNMKFSLYSKSVLPIYSKSIDNESIESMESSSALDIYNLVMNLEKMEYGRALLFELQNTIQTLLQNKKLQNEIKVKREERNEQSAIGGQDAEDREPNTYGLP